MVLYLYQCLGTNRANYMIVHYSIHTISYYYIMYYVCPKGTPGHIHYILCMTNKSPKWSLAFHHSWSHNNIFNYRGLLRDRWDQRKTLKQNLDSLGLAYDSNTAIPIQSGKQTKQVQVHVHSFYEIGVVYGSCHAHMFICMFTLMYT